MTDISTMRVPKEKFMNAISDSEVKGWKLKSNSDNIAILVQYGSWGKWYWHFLYLGITWGLGNILYGLYCRYNGKKELRIMVDDPEVNAK